jgi:hypothetical protein
MLVISTLLKFVCVCVFFSIMVVVWAIVSVTEDMHDND